MVASLISTVMSNNLHYLTGDKKHTYLDIDENADEKYGRSLSPIPFNDDKRSESRSPDPPALERRSSEYSTTRSTYSGVKPVAEKADVPFKELGVYHTVSHLCLRVLDVNDVPLYYVDNSFWTSKKPDVTLHAGSDKTGPILGVSKYTAFSSDVKVGVGDPNVDNGSNMIWEDVIKKSKIKHNRYDWSMTLPGTYERCTFIWKRTHHFGLENEHRTAKWALTNFKLIDGQTGEIVANFANNGIKQWKKMGKVVIRAEYGAQWELMVLLTALAIVEKARRRERAKRWAGAGGVCEC
jgi:hypothetical protein